ncbi:Fur family transcriptional regulator [Dictyobacter arantiisoli]|uniref:Transcriptional repressor n=1 Tax=Dictyobacter arantiisoli TaxID=2014874 RepID=A0A5A5TID6_9CHLR|nr:transcriptional repressor [Dictyobacter arantiisoli]GCF10724.1 transcriptional repressor [Dictyobacter arantiisoli]
MHDRLNKNSMAVLKMVRASHSHPTASEVYEAVRQERPQIGLASIYRILHNLVEQNYIKELRHGDDTCRYDAHTARHDHAICTQCGALLDIPIDVALPQDLLEAAAQATGIEFSSHELRLYGRCPTCQGQAVQHKTVE